LNKLTDIHSMTTFTTAPTVKPGRFASKRSLAIVITLGLFSAGLYLLLFLFSGSLVTLASETRNGNPLYALIPLIIALCFSLVHGAFTSRFWDLLGLKAKRS